jgi:two-component system, NarL family, sensor histidine kinase UhpB
MQCDQWAGGVGSAAAPLSRPRSLHRQLVLIPTAILLAGLVAGVGIVLMDARARIAAEVTSAMELGNELVLTSLHNVASASSPALAFEQLAKVLPKVRHAQFELVPSDGTLFRGSYLRIGEEPPRSRPLLARLLAPPPQQRIFQVHVRGDVVGEIRVRSSSADEIAEIVGEVELFSGILFMLCLLIVASLLWTVRRSIHPVQLLADGFDRLEQGDYRPIEPMPVMEFRRIGEQFNRLAQSLRRVTADNHRLIDRMLSVQEQERKQLAAELHDEFGPALFGIRAEAACMLRNLPADANNDPQIRTHAHTITELADNIQKLNYRMLDRLRPLVLEQMGLSEALRQLLASWRTRYQDMSWSLAVPPRFDEPAEGGSLTLYRIVQEAATNAIRHAQASAVAVRLEWHGAKRDGHFGAATEARGLLLSVEDNGRGLPDDFRCGFGLLGMTERVRQLGGTFRITNAHPSGVIVQAWIPEQEPAAVLEPMHADTSD